MSSIKVSTSDNQVIEVPQEIIKQIKIIDNLVQLKDTIDEPIPLNNVDARTMNKVIEYCVHHKDDVYEEYDETEDNSPKRSDDIDEWDARFMQVDQDLLFSILLASNYLDMRSLLDLGCKTVANMMRNKDAEQIREMFKINGDFTEEEKLYIEKENKF
ncbi:hypothetical protein J3B02_004244 [Coemansia erecta]|uniref:E3 ubiquitin ligase complex SCF subunit n=1 Tax=Coemansia asiatica TaxID=1052880 RepID=A0A9W7XNW0_9FUNG|nr:hypothetical protein LPJ64_001269 [Coemansia asiatica]KAJ2847122.1 hypothetical protein J3B02_004244 [Coemansia erecta]KAJ2878084.1 hypothetical protein FB639_003514 [Coemansia asiatica]